MTTGLIRPLRDGVAAGSIVLAVGLSGIAYVVHQAREGQKEIVRDDLLRTARGAAGLVDGDRHEALLRQGVTGSREYFEALEPLVRFHRGVPEIAYLYTLAERDGRFVFGLDTAHAGSRLGFQRSMEPSDLLEPYESASAEEDAAEMEALREGRDYVSNVPFSDAYGTFLTAVSPIRDQSGQPVAILGVDLNLSEYIQRLDSVERAGRVGSAFLALASLLIGFVVYRFRKNLQIEESRTLVAQQEKAVLIERDHRLVTLLGQIIYHCDIPTGKITWRGDCETLLGYAPGDMPQTLSDVHRVIPNGDLQRTPQPATSPAPLIREFRCLHRDGSTVWMLDRALVDHDASGRILAVDGVLLNISERKRFEAELIASRDAAEAGARAKSDFLAVMSHEIRTPMNGVIGCTNLLLETSVTERQREYLETIRQCGDSLLHIINDVLDFSKMESGKIDLECRPFSLRKCTTEVLSLYQLLALEKGIELLARFEDPAADWIVGDEARIRQILINLVGNAVKFTPAGDVVITASRRPWPPDRTGLMLSVRDTGIGIEEHQQKAIFEPFSQADSSTTRRFGGTGLGLSICGRIATLMGGAITVHSKPGEGSEFVVFIPLDPAPPPVPERSTDALRGRSVWIVSRRSTVRRMLVDELTAIGMKPLALDETSVRPPNRPTPDFGVIDGDFLPGELPESLSEIGEAGLKVVQLVPTAAADAAPLPFLRIAKPLVTGLVTEALLDLAEGQQWRAKPEIVSRPSAPELASPLRVLVAEDNSTNRKVISHMLARLGHTPHLVTNGRECVSAAMSGAFDMILMDVQMPEMDGYEATNALRKQGNKIWITALTADAMPEDPLRCQIAGMNDYLSKPIRPDALLLALNRCATSIDRS